MDFEEPRRPERQRPPRSVVMRRRLVALCVLLAALIGLGFAVASVRDRGHKANTPTVAFFIARLFSEKEPWAIARVCSVQHACAAEATASGSVIGRLTRPLL